MAFEHLMRNSDIHTHNSEGASIFNLSHHNPTLYSRKPTYAGAKLFKILPAEVKRGLPGLLRTWLHRWLLRDPINDSLHEMGQWVQETFPVDTGNSSSSHTSVSHRLWYDIRDLEESSVFQAQLQVRNRYGWSDLSDVYQFYTRAPNEDVVGEFH
ncbi:hypothetical protein J6590_085134 [Homalodisca vitripennis]|nr:hypothetical protein J6590_085134 [Homalodisca vitripennis]